MLCHTTGFQDWRSASDPLRIHFTPGTKYSYSGEGYSYLQSVVTKLAGHEDRNVCATYEASLKVCANDIADYLKANILDPFGMNSSRYVWNAKLAANMAQPHDRNGIPIPAAKSTATDAARYAAAGGLMTTPTDYAKFLIEVINPRPSDSFRLTKSSRDEMLRPQVMVSSEPEYSIWWALGWRVVRTKHGHLIGHGGENPGFQCLTEASVAKRPGFVIMTNGENGVEVLKALAPIVSRRVNA